MATDEKLMTATIQDYFEGWYGADVGEYLHRISTANVWTNLDALWLPQ
jgi:hypothetical protein